MKAAPCLFHLNSEMTARKQQITAGPKKAPMNHGLMTETLMDCMAAMPVGGEMRASALMTKEEKAKKIPAARPQLRATRNVKARSNRTIIERIMGLIQPGESLINSELAKRN